MKALSLRQPWAAMVVHGVDRADGTAERKTIENRRWSTTFRGRFLIHAAKGCTREEYDGALEWIADVLGMGIADQALAFPTLKEIQRGGIIGIATLVDVIPPCKVPLGHACKHKWHMPEQFGFVLEDIKPTVWVPMTGALGFFNVPIAYEKRALAT